MGLIVNFSEIVLDCCSYLVWPLHTTICTFRPQFRILREISSLEPAPKVKIPESRSEHEEIYFLMCFFLNLFMGLVCSDCSLVFRLFYHDVR